MLHLSGPGVGQEGFPDDQLRVSHRKYLEESSVREQNVQEKQQDIQEA